MVCNCNATLIRKKLKLSTSCVNCLLWNSVRSRTCMLTYTFPHRILESILSSLSLVQIARLAATNHGYITMLGTLALPLHSAYVLMRYDSGKDCTHVYNFSPLHLQKKTLYNTVCICRRCRIRLVHI